MKRVNYLYSLPPEKLSPCAALVRDELKLVVKQLVDSGAWQGVEHPAAAAPESVAAQPAEAHS